MRRKAFSLIELLVAIGIIAVLVGILIPVISRVRRSGNVASAKNWVSQLSGAIERYYLDHRAYPGPVAHQQIASAAEPPQLYDAAGNALLPDRQKITGAENLVLGLLGGLKWNVQDKRVCYDPTLVGAGPGGLTDTNAKRFPAYIDAINLSGGKYSDAAGSADDSSIPEFLDTFPEPLPVLYLRARVGASETVSIYGRDTGGANVNADGSPTNYDLREIIAYTSSTIGAGRTLPKYAGGPTAPAHGLRTVNRNAALDGSDPDFTYVHPFDAYPYLNSAKRDKPTDPGTPRQKDTYILISAGADRTYGTADDICSFGDVIP